MNSKTKRETKTVRRKNFKGQKRKKLKRDYKAEYARRVRRASEKGLSLSRARGHCTAAEAFFEPNKLKPIKERDLKKALKEYEKTKSFRKAARKIGVSAERFRNQAFAKKLIRREKGRWKISASYPKTLPIFSEKQQQDIKAPDFATASKVGKYMNGVRNALRSNDPKYLKKFIGQSVTDTEGKIHIFETDMNTLYRITRSSEPIDFYDHS